MCQFLVSFCRVPMTGLLDVGKSGNNTRRFIDVSFLVIHLGPELCQALPGFHAFTGCDYTAAFVRKAKIRPLAVMEKYDFIPTFAQLGESETVSPEIQSKIESFVCSIYGKPKLSSTNEARHAMFVEKFAPKCQAQPMYKMTQDFNQKWKSIAGGLK